MTFEMTRRVAFLGVTAGVAGGGTANPAQPIQVSGQEGVAFMLTGSVVLDYRSTINGVAYRMFIRPPARRDTATVPSPAEEARGLDARSVPGVGLQAERGVEDDG